MKSKLLKITFLFLTIINFIFTAIMMVVGFYTNNTNLAPIVAIATVGSIISTGILLIVNFFFIADKTMRISFIINAVSAVLLIITAITIFS